jgi:hypothetical protein
VHKQKIVPALGHDPRRHGRWPRPMRRGEQNGVRAHPLGAGIGQIGFGKITH